jgi:hypothetical protein
VPCIGCRANKGIAASRASTFGCKKLRGWRMVAMFLFVRLSYLVGVFEKGMWG